MVRFKSSALLGSLTLLVLLGSCANSPMAEQLERSLAADQSLQTNTVEGSPLPTEAVDTGASPTVTAELPANFPAEIPRYPNAVLIQTSGAESDPVAVGTNPITQTRWQTADGATQVQQFYRENFQLEGWQLKASNPESSEQPIQASRDGLQVTVTTSPNASPNPPTDPPTTGEQTKFTISYQLGEATVGEGSPSPVTSPSPANPAPVSPTAVTTFADLNQAPAELQPYITDLAKLGALTIQAKASTEGTAELKPNAEISRREYARWLVTANNLIYANQPARNIRLATASGQAAFQDVPATDPDFGVIQGLANAGLIPSPLSGDSTTVTFRPDAPLTREELILWKVPVDTRQALPTASIEAVQQTWGFQDATKINPKALRAVLADFQNGDSSNIRRAFGYTTLFQPQKTVSRAEAAAVLWQFGTQGNGLSAKDAVSVSQPTPSPQIGG